MGQITTTFSEGFRGFFDEIRKRRPDITNNSEVAQEAVRFYAEWIKADMGNIFIDLHKKAILANEQFKGIYQLHNFLREILKHNKFDESIRNSLIKLIESQKSQMQDYAKLKNPANSDNENEASRQRKAPVV